MNQFKALKVWSILVVFIFTIFSQITNPTIYASDIIPTSIEVAEAINQYDDYTAPTILYVQSLEGNKIKIVFNESMDSTSVQTITNYNILSMGYPVGIISWTPETKTVILRTNVQTSGIVYSIIVNNVKDVSNNLIAINTVAYFAGTSSIDPLGITSVTALNNRQIQVAFNKEVDDKTVSTSDFSIRKNNQEEILFTNLSLNSLNPIYRVDRKTYILTVDEEHTFSGDIYTLKVISNIEDLGGNSIDLIDIVNSRRVFGGVSSSPLTPEILVITQINKRQLEVLFNQDIYADDKTNLITLKSNRNCFINYNNTLDIFAYDTTSSVIRDKTNKKKVIFSFESDIPKASVVYLKILNQEYENFKDITGNIYLSSSNGENKYVKVFGTSSFEDTILSVELIKSIDDSTIELNFNQDIIYNGTSGSFSRQYTSNPAGIPFGTIFNDNENRAFNSKIVYVEQISSDKMRVYFTRGENFKDGITYKFAISDNAFGQYLILKASDRTIIDLQNNENLTPIIEFNNLVHEEPYLVSAESLSENVVKLNFSTELSDIPTTNEIF